MSHAPADGWIASRPELDILRRNLRGTLKPFGPDYWREVDDNKRFPAELFEAMGQAGYYGTLISSEYGGSDASPAVASVVVEEINRSGGDATVVNAQMSICGALARCGSEQQRSDYLPKIASGELRMLTVAATEPDSGADMSDLESTARRDADDWIIDARKVLISLAEHSELMIVLVRTEQGPTLFLLERGDFGTQVEIRPIDLITNRMTTMLFIDGLRVPDSRRLGPIGGGLRCLKGGFAPRRVLAASEALGSARFLLDRSLEHAKTRVTFGRPIGQNQGVQYPLAQAYAKLEAADLMRWDALRLIEAVAESVSPNKNSAELAMQASARSALAKILASEAAWEMARAALTTFGGWGLADEYHVERKLRELSVFVFNNLLMSFISERVLDLPKAY